MDEELKQTRITRRDSVPLDKVEYTPEGFLIDVPIVTSIGIFAYQSPDGGVRRELRLPEHVFDETSLASYEGKPVIITHEAGRVDKDNVTEEIVGTVLSAGYRDGDDVRAKIIIHDIDAVKQSGFRELSLGYDQTPDETPGEWNGQPYDAVQTEIAINHLAIVREARAGEQARLNIDGKENEPKGENAMAQEKKPTQPAKRAMNADEAKKAVAAYEERRKRRLDEAAEAAEAAKADPAANSDAESAVTEEIKENGDTPPATKPSVEERVKLVKDRRGSRDAEGDPADMEQAKGGIATQDEDIAALLEIIEELQATNDLAKTDDAQAAVADPAPPSSPAATVTVTAGNNAPAAAKPMNADSVDAVVAERLKLGRIGDKLNLAGLETLKPLEAKRRIIKAIKPELRLDGKGTAYIDTAFDIAVQELNGRKDTGYQRQQMFNTDGRSTRADANGSADTARERMIERMTNGGVE